jgi:hypothetical protein
MKFSPVVAGLDSTAVALAGAVVEECLAGSALAARVLELADTVVARVTAVAFEHLAATAGLAVALTLGQTPVAASAQGLVWRPGRAARLELPVD